MSLGFDLECDVLLDEMEEELVVEIGVGGKKKYVLWLDVFNLKGEEEEGWYDELGNYVCKVVDLDVVNDIWLDGLSKKDMKWVKEV